jgi:hypothetical protein
VLVESVGAVAQSNRVVFTLPDKESRSRKVNVLSRQGTCTPAGVERAPAELAGDEAKATSTCDSVDREAFK